MGAQLAHKLSARNNFAGRSQACRTAKASHMAADSAAKPKASQAMPPCLSASDIGNVASNMTNKTRCK
jgi:hypothetical protein